MSFSEIVSGIRQRWGLLEKLGEGDAGEVFLVESLLERKSGILKRPRSSAFSSDIMRQAGQIKSEAKIIASLAGRFNPTNHRVVILPNVLDQSPGGAELGEKVFLIIDKASGLDLRTLSNWLVRMPDLNTRNSISINDTRLLEIIHTTGRLPAEFMLRVLNSLVNMFAIIHVGQSGDSPDDGFIWNDIKPEHLFWDTAREILTVIDWGNSQELGPDGYSKDRRYSRANDTGQFLEVFRQFLNEFSPGMVERLGWPEIVPGQQPSSDDYEALKERIVAEHDRTSAVLRDLRRQESDLVAVSLPTSQQIDQLLPIQEQILAHGSSPDWLGTVRLYERLATDMAENQDLAGVSRTAGMAAAIDSRNTEKWKLIHQVVGFTDCIDERGRKYVCQAVSQAINGDWAGCMWDLVLAGCFEKAPDEWEKFITQVRSHALGLSDDAISPYTAATRLYYTMQSIRIENGDQSHGSDDTLQLIQVYSDEVIKKWRQDEPLPPYSGVEYGAVDWLAAKIESILPAGYQVLDKALLQPRARVDIFLNAWRERDFDAARKGLRSIFLWDPDRFRVFIADRMIRLTPRWLLRVRQGPDGSEAFPDYLTEIELKGREIRNLVGTAPWLDLILDSLKQLRSGERPVDLLMAYPELLNDMPWLSEYRSRETMRLSHLAPFSFERKPAVPQAVRIANRDGKLGQGKDLQLAAPLDTWLPEARGSSARVFYGHYQDTPGDFAVKIMRPDRVEYALPLFREEAQILSLLRDVPGVIPLLEAGFIQVDNGRALPMDDRSHSASELGGSLLRFGPEQVQNYLAILERQTSVQWLPYLVMGIQRHENNLVMICDAGHTHGWFLPLRESLYLCIQICDILQIAHDRNIVYRDHKLLHYYWDPAASGVQMIDWNIARHHPQGLNSAEKQFDIVQFGARGLHHILTGRTAPGALPLGPNRPEDIEHSADKYVVHWTYDDERLPNRVKDVIAAVLNNEYMSFRELRQDLFSIYSQLPE